MPAKKVESVRYCGTGRRKASVARVYLVPGNGSIVVNGVDVANYFPHATNIMDLKQPLELTGTTTRFDIKCTVKGGGFTGQTGAIRLGIARALLEASADYRPTLKAAGMLTRDARVKERYHYGLKKARRASQFSKR